MSLNIVAVVLVVIASTNAAEFDGKLVPVNRTLLLQSLASSSMPSPANVMNVTGRNSTMMQNSKAPITNTQDAKTAGRIPPQSPPMAMPSSATLINSNNGKNVVMATNGTTAGRLTPVMANQEVVKGVNNFSTAPNQASTMSSPMSPMLMTSSGMASNNGMAARPNPLVTNPEVVKGMNNKNNNMMTRPFSPASSASPSNMMTPNGPQPMMMATGGMMAPGKESPVSKPVPAMNVNPGVGELFSGTNGMNMKMAIH